MSALSRYSISYSARKFAMFVIKKWWLSFHFKILFQPLKEIYTYWPRHKFAVFYSNLKTSPGYRAIYYCKLIRLIFVRETMHQASFWSWVHTTTQELSVFLRQSDNQWLCFFKTFPTRTAKVTCWRAFCWTVGTNLAHNICLISTRNTIIRMLLFDCTVWTQATFLLVQVLNNGVRVSWCRAVDSVLSRPHRALIRRSGLAGNKAWVHSWVIAHHRRFGGF